MRSSIHRAAARPIHLVACRSGQSCRGLTSITSSRQRPAKTTARTSVQSKRTVSTKPFHTIESCPEGPCVCEMPDGMDIDYSSKLDGSMPFYNQHVLISTGVRDWPSKIEDGNAIAKGLRERLTLKGKYYDDTRDAIKNTISATSFETSEPHGRTSVMLFPQFQEFSGFLESPEVPNPTPETSFDDLLDKLCQVQLVKGPGLMQPPAQLSEQAQTETDIQIKRKDIEGIVVLICSHNSRDERCGVIGPLLDYEIRTQIAGVPSLALQPRPTFGRIPRTARDPVQPVAGEEEDLATADAFTPISIGHISHVGGHKWAGNMIIYFSPRLRNHPLAGTGIWYGRVEPKHVRGILSETIEKGIIIKSLFRGGIESVELESGKRIGKPLPLLSK